MADRHRHPGVVHDHEHFHVTHYHRPGEDWAHLTATHRHLHDHPQVHHEHEAHEDKEAEHLREAHIHDHKHPVQ